MQNTYLVVRKDEQATVKGKQEMAANKYTPTRRYIVYMSVPSVHASMNARRASVYAHGHAHGGRFHSHAPPKDARGHPHCDFA